MFIFSARNFLPLFSEKPAAPEIGSGFMESNCGAGFWHVWHGPDSGTALKTSVVAGADRIADVTLCLVAAGAATSFGQWRHSVNDVRTVDSAFSRYWELLVVKGTLFGFRTILGTFGHKIFRAGKTDYTTAAHTHNLLPNKFYCVMLRRARLCQCCQNVSVRLSVTFRYVFLHNRICIKKYHRTFALNSHVAFI